MWHFTPQMNILTAKFSFIVILWSQNNMQLLAVTNYRKQALLVIPLHRILEKQRLHFKEDYSSASNSNFLSMEYQVLDNLPHDLVYSPDQVSPWMEVWIEKIKGRFVTFVFSEYLQNIAANLYPLLCTS